MTSRARRRLHTHLAIFFAVQIPVSLAAQHYYPEQFREWWPQYLIFLSLYAIVATHWAAREADTPNDEGER